MKMIVDLNEIKIGDYIEITTDAGGIDAAPFTQAVVKIESPVITVTNGEDSIEITPVMENYDQTVVLKSGKLCHIFVK